MTIQMARLRRGEPPYLRMSELAARAGVSIATIKYYIREGLLPPPPVKTGRTMGYYDEAYLERLLLIRRLREVHFLPIRVIRAVLAEQGERPLLADEAATLARVAHVVQKRLDPDASAPRPVALSRAELLSRYPVRPEELDLLEELGLIGDREVGGGEVHYHAADLELLEALLGAEAAGLSRDRFPLEEIGHYVELLGELARREVRMFLRHMAGVPAEEQQAVAARAVEATEPVIAVLRRKLILQAIRRHQEHESRSESHSDKEKAR